MDFNSFFEQVKVAFRENWNELVSNMPEIVLSILIVVIGILISNFLTRLFRRTVARKSKDPLMTNFLSKFFKTVLVILVIMFALNTAGLSNIATAIFTAAGASALIFGFAFKDIGENFISGVILSFNRPFDVNDTVLVDDIFGKVKAMEFRYTKLKTFDGRDVYIPNSHIIKKPVFNYTEDGFFRQEFLVGIAYEDSIEHAREIILQTIKNATGVIEDETHEVVVAVDELGVSTVNLKVLFWVHTREFRRHAVQIRSDIISKVKDALLENKVNLPGDIKEIKLYGNEESLRVSITKES
ncbi:MAG: mechanosensitive ion channel family protein [Flavobacteriaceae bacterium]